jgi:hypothetical protein
MAKMKKDKFDLLEQEWRDAVQGLDAIDIKKRVAETALNQAELMRAKKEDMDLQEKKESYSDASSVYREGTKMNKMKIEFMKMVLDGRGK